VEEELLRFVAIDWSVLDLLETTNPDLKFTAFLLAQFRLSKREEKSF
jgi:hypothetical protein